MTDTLLLWTLDKYMHMECASSNSTIMTAVE